MSRSVLARPPRTRSCSSSPSTMSPRRLVRAQELGGTIVQSEQKVPGTEFGVFADAQGHRIGVAANG
jgi:hypothetical protein